MNGDDSDAAARQGRRTPRLWVFNLDAERELAKPQGYQTPEHVARSLAVALPAARRLKAPGDTELGTDQELGTDTRLGRAWCPTPSALRRLRSAGVRPEPSPGLEVLQRVNHRRFAHSLGGGAPGARFVESAADVSATLREAGGGAWLFKRCFGFAGRGQRRIAGSPSADDERWLADGLRQGGLLAEPWLELVREICVHGYVHPSGRHELGRLTLQRTDGSRAWLGSALASSADISTEMARSLLERGEAIAAALCSAGYFGPFGIDAYQFRTATGELRFNPLGELNARYSMGFAVGMADALLRV